jgi:hypothetical protein
MGRQSGGAPRIRRGASPKTRSATSNRGGVRRVSYLKSRRPPLRKAVGRPCVMTVAQEFTWSHVSSNRFSAAARWPWVGALYCEVDVRSKTKTGVSGELVDGLQVAEVGGARLLFGRQHGGGGWCRRGPAAAAAGGSGATAAASAARRECGHEDREDDALTAAPFTRRVDSGPVASILRAFPFVAAWRESAPIGGIPLPVRVCGEWSVPGSNR